MLWIAAAIAAPTVTPAGQEDLAAQPIVEAADWSACSVSNAVQVELTAANGVVSADSKPENACLEDALAKVPAGDLEGTWTWRWHALGDALADLPGVAVAGDERVFPVLDVIVTEATDDRAFRELAESAGPAAFQCLVESGRSEPVSIAVTTRGGALFVEPSPVEGNADLCAVRALLAAERGDLPDGSAVIAYGLATP